jgi:Fe-S cluster assembly ATP-binding protein
MLTVKNLHVSLNDGPTILNGVDLSIKPGEIHAIMGPNGSGKSTLAYALAGHPFYHLDQGQIKLNQQDLSDLTPDQRAQAGLFLAFQYPVTIEGISVQNFLKSAYDHLHPQNGFTSVLKFRQHLADITTQLDLDPEILKRSLNDGFSGGEKKRVEVLQMLTLKPKVAIFDETDSGLDIDSIKIAAAGINQAVTDFNTGCIVITHYQRILEYIKPDHVHVMIKGKIARSGGPALVKELEKSGYKKLLTTNY